MKSNKLKEIVINTVLKFLNEARFDIPQKIPISTTYIHDFNVPVKKKEEAKKQPKIHPSVLKSKDQSQVGLNEEN